jgi:hypothetical protein
LYLSARDSQETQILAESPKAVNLTQSLNRSNREVAPHQLLGPGFKRHSRALLVRQNLGVSPCRDRLSILLARYVQAYFERRAVLDLRARGCCPAGPPKALSPRPGQLPRGLTRVCCRDDASLPVARWPILATTEVF